MWGGRRRLVDDAAEGRESLEDVWGDAGADEEVGVRLADEIEGTDDRLVATAAASQLTETIGLASSLVAAEIGRDGKDRHLAFLTEERCSSEVLVGHEAGDGFVEQALESGHGGFSVGGPNYAGEEPQASLVVADVLGMGGVPLAQPDLPLRDIDQHQTDGIEHDASIGSGS